MTLNRLALPSAILCLVLEAGLAAPTAGSESPTYNRDIRPILADNCFNCHGQDPKTRKAGLRLDLPEEALKGGKSGAAAIVPGDPQKSELIVRINATDEDEAMPPKDSGKPLTPEQKSTLARWIATGGAYEKHWAFVAPVRPMQPQLQGRGVEGIHPMDAFVRARLKQEGLVQAREASPQALIRRVALDLTGLPPSWDEVDAFVRAFGKSGPLAYRDLVERLLASPHFGEKWARHWLDAARYADSDGYEKDLPRSQWAWRDWVVRSINADMPYDRFLVEQVAGDLLPDATQDQKVATGFLRNGMVNEEGAIIAEQFRMEGMFDRMDCIGKAVLGVTLQCAQCHTHKFDPLSHEEYYRMFAFLNDTHEAQMWVYSPDQTRQIERIHRETARADAELKVRIPDWSARLARWEQDLKDRTVAWHPLDAAELEWVGGLSHPGALPDRSILTLGFRPTLGELYVVATNQTTVRPTGLRLEALTHGDLPFGGPGRGANGTFAISELEVEVRPTGTSNTNWTRLKLQNATADFGEPERPLPARHRKGPDDKRIVGPAGFLVDGKDETAWGGDRGPGRRHEDIQWVAQFAPTNTWPSGPVDLKIWLKYRHGGEDGHGRDSLFLGRFRLSTTTDPNPVADGLSPLAREALQIEPSRRSPRQQAALFAAWRSTVPDAPQAVLDARLAIEALWKDHPEGESVLNFAARIPGETRETFLLDRGAWDKPKQRVEPGTPVFLHALNRGTEPDRLTFARWLVDPQSPTTARVFVNRVWQAIFGIGLVETPEDFGMRAALATHPELLDWLAVEFMKPSRNPPDGTIPQPWSLKNLIRQIVNSETYRQDSRVTPAQLERDPANKLLARGPRLRAEAEVVRDVALSAAGLLHTPIGGASFYPPVPESMFALNFVKLDWKAAPAPERYRRSLYMFRRRSMPDPVMSGFDAPNADFACVRRMRSNTPLAALTSMNETVFVEAAQALAMRVLRDGGGKDTSRAVHAYRLCLGRNPNRAEIREVLQLIESRERHAAEGWISPRVVAFGDAPIIPPLPPGTNPSQAAAWTVVARVLLNLDETLTKQ